jgi:opacity protein-like surface antigen
MKKLLLVPAILFSLVITALTQAPQAALAGGIGNNNIGPSVTFGGGSSVFGIDSKIGVSDNIAIRPFIAFPSGGTNYGASLTYDWDLRQSPLSITPFVGLGAEFQSVNQTTQTTGFAQIGADLDVSDSLALLGAVAVPFSNSNGNTTTFTLGAGLRF